MHYLYRYVCILNVFLYVYGQLSAIKNLLLLLLKFRTYRTIISKSRNFKFPKTFHSSYCYAHVEKF